MHAERTLTGFLMRPSCIGTAIEVILAEGNFASPNFKVKLAQRVPGVSNAKLGSATVRRSAC